MIGRAMVVKDVRGVLVKVEARELVKILKDGKDVKDTIFMCVS